MADALLRLAAEPTLAATLREAGLRQVQQYTWASVRPRLLAVYEAVLAARAVTPVSQP
jgi:glycosyltransferase involved in cell wall biosynthesis